MLIRHLRIFCSLHSIRRCPLLPPVTQPSFQPYAPPASTYDMAFGGLTVEISVAWADAGIRTHAPEWCGRNQMEQMWKAVSEKEAGDLDGLCSWLGHPHRRSPGVMTVDPSTIGRVLGG